MDYLWPLLAGIGMLGAVSEIRAKVAGDWVETEQTRAVAILESVQQFSLNKLRSDVCNGQPSLDNHWYFFIYSIDKIFSFNSVHCRYCCGEFSVSSVKP